MRMCRTFKTVDSIQPVLDFLEDYGYIAQKPQKYSGHGQTAASEVCRQSEVLKEHSMSFVIPSYACPDLQDRFLGQENISIHAAFRVLSLLSEPL
jgi:hypothetical protein